MRVRPAKAEELFRQSHETRRKIMSNKALTVSRIGAVFYVIWGLLHFNAAYEVYQLGAWQVPAMVQARLYQGAWNLTFFASVAIVIAVWLNWRNALIGYWINLLTVSVTDIGFMIFVMLRLRIKCHGRTATTRKPMWSERRSGSYRSRKADRQYIPSSLKAPPRRTRE